MKKIITDCDGVLLDWAFAFNIWMREQGHFVLPETEHHFDLSKRYGIPKDEAVEKVHYFNQLGVLGFIPAYKDSVEYVTRLAREGWRFDVITAIGQDKYSHELRRANLLHLFGDVFDSIQCNVDFTKSKKDVLMKYKEHNYVWIEDRTECAKDGDEVGLKSYIMDHPYNKDYSGRRVNNWKDLYDREFANV